MKLIQVVYCPQCQEVFSSKEHGKTCPSCTNRFTELLCGLIWRKEKENATVNLQEKIIREGNLFHPNTMLNYNGILTDVIKQYDKKLYPGDTIPVILSHKTEPSEFEIGKSDYPSGKRMESKSSIKERCDRPFTSYAFVREVFRFLKRGFEMSRKEHHSRNNYIKALSKEQS